MKAIQLNSKTIAKLLSNRLNSTNRLYNLLKTSFNQDIDIQKTLYFRYFFDFSTAIEAICRGIAFEEANKSKNKKYFVYVGQIDELSKSFFLGQEEISPLVYEFSLISQFVDKINFEKFINKIPCLSGYTRVFDATETPFRETYLRIRKTRNILAHGLQELNVDYTQDTLYDFALVYCGLLNYYKHVEKKRNVKKSN